MPNFRAPPPANRGSATAFWREPSKPIKSLRDGQGSFPARFPRLPHAPIPLAPYPKSTRTRPKARLALRKNQRAANKRLSEPLGLAGVNLPGHAMACSLWDPPKEINGSALAPPIRPTNEFHYAWLPTSLKRGRPFTHALPRPRTTGRLHCQLATKLEYHSVHTNANINQRSLASVPSA